MTKKKIPKDPAWLCLKCGNRYGRGMPIGHISTWHLGQCGICKRHISVTEPRDFNHLKTSWKKIYIKDYVRGC